jgi:hypothetical protein
MWMKLAIFAAGYVLGSPTRRHQLAHLIQGLGGRGETRIAMDVALNAARAAAGRSGELVQMAAKVARGMRAA